MKTEHYYLGHPEQIAGAEFFRREGGTADRTKVCRIRNGRGLEVILAADRCADAAEVVFMGCNLGFLAPCGHRKANPNGPFLSNFSAGFITTCGFENVGSPNMDEGEELTLHGSIGNTPCQNFFAETRKDGIRVSATVYDASLFGRNMKLEREYFFPFDENAMILWDTVTNLSDREVPMQILYHCNTGYPLLDEDAIITIPSTEVTPRNPHSAEGIATWQVSEKPQMGYEEMCFFHKMEGKTAVSIEQPKKKLGFRMEYDTADLPYFTQWKMMGQREYVMGLEPGNCTPDGRAAQRADGTLTVMKPEESRTYELKFVFYQREA